MRKRPDRSTVEVPVSIPAPPLSPWLRIASIDSQKGFRQEAKASRARWHDDYEIIIQLEGTTWIWCDILKGSLEVRPGDVLFIPPRFTHSWHYEDEAHLYTHFDLHANPKLLAYLMLHDTGRKGVYRPVTQMPVFRLEFEDTDPARGLRIPLITRPRMPDIWHQKFDTLVQIHTTHAENTLEAQMAINETITWALSSLSNGEGQALRVQSDVHPEIANLIQKMKDPRTRAEVERLSTELLAKRAGMGETVFRAAFKAATGRNPHQYLLERRMEQAAQLLVNTDMKIRDVARALGYDDQYHFSHTFTKVMQDAPSHYRTIMRTVRRSDAQLPSKEGRE